VQREQVKYPTVSGMTIVERLAQTLANIPEGELDDAPRLWVGRCGAQLAVDFYGDPGQDACIDLLEALKDPSVAPHLATLTLRSPDVGANGTRGYHLGSLTSLKVERNHPEAHNRGVIGDVDGEFGVLGELLRCCPSLQMLEVPSAPDASFFEVAEHPLRHLSVDAGYDHQRFVRNVATSSCFPKLNVLEFGEYEETYMDDFASRVTPDADYETLFTSPLMRQLSCLTLRNPRFPETLITNFRKPGLQLKIVRTSYAYGKFPSWS
jgi:hypothetical protein